MSWFLHIFQYYRDVNHSLNSPFTLPIVSATHTSLTDKIALNAVYLSSSLELLLWTYLSKLQCTCIDLFLHFASLSIPWSEAVRSFYYCKFYGTSPFPNFSPRPSPSMETSRVDNFWFFTTPIPHFTKYPVCACIHTYMYTSQELMIYCLKKKSDSSL